jgi:HEPN domain-containing protein
MTRRDLQWLASARLLDAEHLFNAKAYSGAYHFAGVAVECAIKACIAKQTKRFEFPNKPLATAAWEHDITKLIKVANLQNLLEQERARSLAFDQNWTTIIKWQIDSRYDLSTSRTAASVLIASIAHQPDGVLPWLQVYW